MEIWRGVLAAEPEHPVALARLARAEWTLGELRPAAATAHHEAGEDYGWSCLAAWPGFSAALTAERWRVTEEAVAALPPEASDCLLWTAINAIAAVEARGPGAALALDDVRLLLARAAAVGEGADPGFLVWARAQAEVLAAAPNAPPEAARAGFEAAIAAAPAVGRFRRDYAAAYPKSVAAAYEGFPPRAGADPWARENAAWAARQPAR